MRPALCRPLPFPVSILEAAPLRRAPRRPTRSTRIAAGRGSRLGSWPAREYEYGRDEPKPRNRESRRAAGAYPHQRQPHRGCAFTRPSGRRHPCRRRPCRRSPCQRGCDAGCGSPSQPCSFIRPRSRRGGGLTAGSAYYRTPLAPRSPGIAPCAALARCPGLLNRTGYLERRYRASRFDALTCREASEDPKTADALSASMP